MRILHTSDLHLGSPLTTRLSALRADERKRELISSFRAMLRSAEAYGCSAVIIAGDLFDDERVGIRILAAVTDIIDSFKNLTFFYLPGNHEGKRLLSSGVPIPENLRLFGEEWTYYELDGVRFVGRSEIRENAFDTLMLDKDKVNIAVMHGALTDKTSVPDKIGLRDIEKTNINYLALGHYHTYGATNISDTQTAVYSGTPEGRGFDEAGDKGYVIIDVENGRVSHTFVKHAKRVLRIVEADISGAQREVDIETKVACAIAQISRDDLVRVVLKGKRSPEIRIDTASLTECFASSYYYLEIRDESRIAVSSDDYLYDKSLKGEFIRLVLSDEALSEDEKKDIIECGIRALVGETV
jgi:DNA repair exonuclease SbcCD nuclease subunit